MFAAKARRRARLIRCAAPALGGVVLLVGLLVLVVGWGLSSERLITVFPGLASMAPSTSVLFVVCGAAVIWQTPRPRRRWVKQATRLVAAVAAAVAAGDLIVVACSSASGIDEIVLRHPLTGAASMSPATALNFLGVSACLATVGARGRRSRIVFVGAGALVITTSLVALTGYAFDAAALYQVSIFTAMALHTAACFVVLMLSLLAVVPTAGWLGIVIGEGAGSRTVRRLLPAVLAGPFIFAWLTLWATRRGYVGPEFRLGLLAIGCAGLLVILLLRTGALQNATDRRLRRTRDALRASVAHRELLLREVNHRVKNNLQLVGALLHLESRDLEDAAARAAFDTMHDRVRALATGHSMLVGAADLAALPIDEFLNDLCETLSEGLGARERSVAMHVEADSGIVQLDFAVPLGLLVNEIVTNALRHAFTDGQDGHLLLEFRFRDDGGATLIVRDDGRGFDDAASRNGAGPTAGMAILDGLAAQLGAEISVNGDHGVTVEVSFPVSAVGART